MKKLILSVAVVAMSCGLANAQDTTTGLIANYDFETGTSASGSTVAVPGSSADGTVVVDQTGTTGDLTFEQSQAGLETNIVSLADVLPNGNAVGSVYHGSGQRGNGQTSNNGFAKGGSGTNPNGVPQSFTLSAWYKGNFADRNPVLDNNNTGTGEQFFTLGGLSATIGTSGTGSPPGPAEPTEATGLVFTHRFRDDDVSGVPDADGDERDDWNPQPKGDGTILYADAVWHLVTMTYDGDTASPTAGLISMYVDGVLTNTGQKSVALHTTSQGLDPNSTSRIVVGGEGDGRNVAGYLDDLRLYDRALTAEDVRALFVPEPTSIAIAAIGMFGLAGLRRRRRS